MMFPTSLKGQEIKACYEVRADITVFCCLQVLTVSSDGQTLEAIIGLRNMGDATLAVGTRLVIKPKELGELTESGTLYILRVDHVEKNGPRAVHQIRLLTAQEANHQREHERFALEVDAYRNADIRFKTTNISLGGVQLKYQATLTSIILDQPFPVHIRIDGKPVAFECSPRYIKYNWWEQCHTMGAAFINLTPTQQAALESLLSQAVPLPQEPALTVSEAVSPALEEVAVHAAHAVAEPSPSPPKEEAPKARKTMIDPESGRIRFEH